MPEEKRRVFLAVERWAVRATSAMQDSIIHGTMMRCQNRDCGALNPDPLGRTCWQCGTHSLTCPLDGLFVVYDTYKNTFRCQKAGCPHRDIPFVARASEPAITPQQWENLMKATNSNDSASTTNHTDTEQEIPKTPAMTLSKPDEIKKARVSGIRRWQIALLLVFALSLIGLAISALAGTIIPLWLILGFSSVFLIEKEFSYVTRKYKEIGIPYRLLLNLSVVSLGGLLIWSGIKLFSKSLGSSPMVGTAVFVTEFVFFVWMWRVVFRNRWRWPSMKLTVSCLIGLLLVGTFAGVEPLATVKDRTLASLSTWWASLAKMPTSTPGPTPVRPIPQPPKTAEPSPTVSSPTTLTSHSTERASESQQAFQIDIAELERRIHDLINTERVQNGLSPLKWNDTLGEIARKHSTDMALRGYFDHVSPNGVDLSDRYDKGGFAMKLGAAENIFQTSVTRQTWYLYGVPTYSERNSLEEIARSAIEGWMNSPGHRRNILTPFWENEGIGVSISSDGKVYVTQNFG
ncbi:MAG: CAP domain-containing protein [Chloroflexi bacterium]|nr:CAP domain-containing protein [Chloroflexota bacterium]